MGAIRAAGQACPHAVRSFHLTSQGLGLAATAVMFAATMVIAFAAPI